MDKPKLYTLQQLYELGGCKLPFKAQWYQPSNSRHGEINSLTRFGTVCNSFQGPGKGGRCSNPSSGYGWVIPGTEASATTNTEVNKLLETYGMEATEKRSVQDVKLQFIELLANEEEKVPF